MNVSIVLKVRLYLKNDRQSVALEKLSKCYRNACSYASNVYFRNRMDMSKTDLQDSTYPTLRKTFGLKSQFACSVPRTIRARYSAVDTQLKRKRYSFRDENSKKWYHGYKSKYWLWHPIHFRRPQADLVHNRDWSLTKNEARLSVNTLSKRIKVDYHLPKYFYKYLKQPHTLGTAKLVRNNSHWFLHISCTVDAPDFDYHKQTKNTVGVDRGLRFIAYTYDSHKHSMQFKGLHTRRKRRHFLKQRKTLQAKGTKSAKRKLKTISGRENGWMTDVNHQISKALVQHYGKRNTFVLEDLRGVRFSTEQVPKKYRYAQISWPFYQLGRMLKYKAKLNQDDVININPQYTSQRCPNCGRVLATNRNHHKHVYHCQYCGYTSNDDRIGAMNIRWLGVQKVHAKSKYKHPRIIPSQMIDENGQLSLF